MPVLFKLGELYYPRSVSRFSELDEPEVAIVRALVRPGDHVVDAGAHVGCYTKVLADAVGETGHVYAIEPIPPTFRVLEKCLKRLRLSNVNALQCGVSDVDRHAVMLVPTERGVYNFYQSRVVTGAASRSAGSFDVQLRCIDDIVPSGPEKPANIAFIKLDVEGHELEALRGAARVLARCRPALMVEVSGNLDIPATGAHPVEALLIGFGYSPWWYDGSQLRARARGDCAVNYFFLTRTHIEHLCEQGLVRRQTRREA